tara:strand:- start:4004 stop:4828 length:825 start_codon:yes stop_codon:yes gene_type:complete
MIEQEEKYITNHKTSLKNYTCSQCNKSYQDRSGLWKHKKTCTGPEETTQSKHTEFKNTSDLAVMVKTMMEPIIQNIQDDKKVTLGLVEQMQTQNKIITDIIPKIGNNNNSNNRFNINVFLNEHCRNAINMTDFINSLQIKLADLMYTKHNGLIEGISSVFVNALNKLETCQRPIHCTDVKRETLYIKDNNAWERENSKEKLHSAISKVAHQQRKTITEWEKANKNWQDSEAGSQEYIHLVREVTKDVVPEENKIIKNIIKETAITKDEVNDSAL